MSDCLFCRIAAGDVPAGIVYQDADLVAFADIDPQAPAHVLVIPRAHITAIDEAGEEHRDLLGRLLLAAAEVARRTGVAESGYRTVINTGRDANQSVPHLHLHVLGGRELTWPPG